MKYVSLICLLISLNAFIVQAQNNRATSAEPTVHFKARKDSLLLLDSLRISIKSSDGSNNKGLVPIAESVVLLSESLFGHQHPEFAKDMNQYAVLLWRTGAYQKADSIYTVCEMILGDANLKNAPIYANVRGNHGNVLQHLGKLDIAEQMMLEALQIYEHIGYKDSLDYLTFIGNLGSLYTNKGQFGDAIKCFETNQKGLYQLFGPTSIKCAMATNNLGSFYGMLAQYDKAEQFLLEAKNIYEVNKRTTTNGYGRCITNLGLVYYGTGRIESALDYLKLGLEIREQVLGKMHPEVMGNLANLANFYQKTGQFTLAEQNYQELLKRYDTSSIHNTPEYAALLGNLSGFYRVVGRYKESIDAVQKGIHICENTIGKQNPKYADLLQLHGIILKQMGSLNESKDKMRESLLIYKETKGENSLEYAIALHNISDVYLLQDSLSLADKYEQASLDIYRIISDTLSSPYLAIGYKNLGSIRFAQKSYNASERYYNIACNLLESIFGKDNYELAECLQDLALCQASAGSYVQALDNLRTSGNIFRQFLTVNTETMSEHEAQSFLAQFDYNLNRFFSTLYGANQSQTETVNLGFAYDNVLFYKAFLLQFSVSRRQKILSLNDAEIKSQYLHWLALQRQLFKAYEKPLKDRGNIDSLEIIVSRAEKEVLSKISELRLFYKTVSWKDVQSNLTNGEAAVEFVKFPAYADSIKYAALILRPEDSAPKFIPLFEAETLKSFLRGASGGSNFLKINELYSQKSLYDLLWKPLEPHLKGINTVYCAPSGLLHRLNLAAISTPEGQVYGQRRQLVVLGSTRSLAIGTKASQLAVGSSRQAVSHDAYLAGGIRYDSDSILVAYASRGDVSRSGEADALPFQPDSLSITRGGVLEYLPATAAEVGELSQTLRSAGYQTQTDTGFYATEESFRRLGTDKPSPQVVHLATHGYFFPDPAVSKKQLAIGNEPVFKMSDHPMIRSGLILAGAKQAWLTGKHPEGQEDGILTAYEISQMNLSNTELVVLSACETGLGDIVGNEGVYGLQRAFKIAGAKYLIMSLWKVDDQSTRAFMRAFYRHWLSDKQSISQAFRATQQEMRAKYAGAYDWAGFVLIE